MVVPRPGVALVLLLALIGAACGSSAPAAGPTSATEDSQVSATTTPAVPEGGTEKDSDEPQTTSSTQPSTSPTTPTSVEPTTSDTDSPETSDTRPPDSSLIVRDEVDRAVLVSSVLVADGEGNVLGTVLDPAAAGCEGSAPSFYATIGEDGTTTPMLSDAAEGPRYAGQSKVSPNGGRLLDVESCEGFLGAVTVYEIAEDLGLVGAVAVDTLDSIAGDARWNADGFITMTLSDENAFYVDAVDDGEEPQPPNVVEYLVNPRTGESTQSGGLDELRFGAVRLPDGRLIYSEWGEEPFVAILGPGEEEERFAASGFSLSPDRTWLALWDADLGRDREAANEGTVTLYSMDAGTSMEVGTSPSLNLIWSEDSGRFAFASERDTVIFDIASGDSLRVSESQESNCSAEEDFVFWGRIPLAFAPNGDLYVGDPVCSTPEGGFPLFEYRLHQLTLS